jgi:transposase-like protein
METRRKILNCYRKGDGIRKISREFGIARNTVREIIRSHKSGEAKGIKGELVIPSYVGNDPQIL